MLLWVENFGYRGHTPLHLCSSAQSLHLPSTPLREAYSGVNMSLLCLLQSDHSNVCSLCQRRCLPLQTTLLTPHFRSLGTDISMLSVNLHEGDCAKTGTTSNNQWTSILLVSERAYSLHAAVDSGSSTL